MKATQERALADWLRRREPAMLELLEALVNMDSGSSDKGNVDQVGLRLEAALREAGIATVRHPLPEHGDCVSGELPGACAGQGHVLLLGHMDTVFPPGTAQARPFRVDGRTAYGPGVADMKAGLVMNLFVVRAFAEVGGNPLPLRVLFTGDEEIASPPRAA